MDLSVIPSDIVEHTLSFLSGSFLVHTCRLVSQDWREIVDRPSLWRTKCERERTTPTGIPHEDLDYKELYFKHPYDRNLVKNWDASQGTNESAHTEHWSVINLCARYPTPQHLRCHGNANMIRVEDPPDVCERVPDEAGCTRCWALSYEEATMSQVIDLKKEGCSEKVLDQLTPKVHVYVWVAPRGTCGSQLTMSVKLLDAEHQTLDTVVDDTFREPRGTTETWRKLEHTIKAPPGTKLRFIELILTGRDTMFWAGHYGPKIAAPNVRLQF